MLDSSAALARVYLEECTGAIEHVFELIIEGGAWVPGLWKLEIANILETGARRGRHYVAFSDAGLADLLVRLRAFRALLHRMSPGIFSTVTRAL